MRRVKKYTKGITAGEAYPWPRSEALPAPLCGGHDNPDLWHSEEPADIEAAKEICERCPLIDLCREVAVARREWGVWGGVLHREGKPLDRLPRRGRPPRKTPTAA